MKSSRTTSKRLPVVQTLDQRVKRHRKIQRTKEKHIEQLESAGWELVTEGSFKLDENPLLIGANSFFMASRRPSFSEVFDLLFGGTVATAVAGDRLDHLQDYQRYLALRMLLHAQPKPKDENNAEQQAYLAMKSQLLEETGSQLVVWGANKYFQMRKRFPFSTDVAKNQMSTQWSKLIRVGQSVVLDEKQKKFRGRSKYIKMNRSKPDPIGHMVTQLMVEFDQTPIPFCTGLFPYEANKELGDRVPNDSIISWACNLINQMVYSGIKPVLINDSFYTTTASREVCASQSQPYIMAQKSTWWAGIDAMLSPHVSKPGESAFAWNSGLNSVVCAYYDPKFGKGKKLVTSNAFTKVSGDHWCLKNPPVYAHYAAGFNLCDRFNHALHGNWYPFRASHWEKHFELMFLSMAFMNFYSACMHLKLIDPEVSFNAFLKLAGSVLAEEFFSK